jgi:hypothetical protein
LGNTPSSVDPFTNGKIERFFRTFKLWQRRVLLGLKADTIQHRLDIYRDWYNTQRPMPALGGWTPDQAHRRQPPLKAVPIRARDPAPVLHVVKRDYGGDPYLPVIEISFAESFRAPRGVDAGAPQGVDAGAAA